jgi:hypothetical protein
MQPSRERSYCTTRKSCCQTETSGSQKSQPLLVQMHHTDNGEEFVQAGRTVYIGGVVTSDAAGRISFVQPYTSTYSSRHCASRWNRKPGYTAGGCIASVLLIEATKQLNGRLSIFSTLLTDLRTYLSRRLAILSALSVSLACLYWQYIPVFHYDEGVLTRIYGDSQTVHATTMLNVEKVHRRRYDIQAIHAPNAPMMPANGIKRQMLHQILGASKCDVTSVQ